MYAPVVLSNAERFATVTFVPLGLTAFLNFPPTKRVLPHCARAYDFPFVPQVGSGALDRANAGCASAENRRNGNDHGDTNEAFDDHAVSPYP